MKVYAQLEEGIIRYLELSKVKIEVLLRMGILDEDKVPFWKMEGSGRRFLVLDISQEDYNLLFTKSFQEGKYVGDVMEDCINHAFFRFLLL